MYALISSEKVIVILRDGRKLIGILRSYDQFGTLVKAYAANLVLQEAIERILSGTAMVMFPKARSLCVERMSY